MEEDQIVQERRRTLKMAEDYLERLEHPDDMEILRDELKDPDSTPDETILLRAIRGLIERRIETIETAENQERLLDKLEEEVKLLATELEKE